VTHKQPGVPRGLVLKKVYREKEKPSGPAGELSSPFPHKRLVARERRWSKRASLVGRAAKEWGR